MIVTSFHANNNSELEKVFLKKVDQNLNFIKKNLQTAEKIMFGERS